MSFISAYHFSSVPYIEEHIKKHQVILKNVLSVIPDTLKDYITGCVINEKHLKIYVTSSVASSQLRFITPKIQQHISLTTQIKLDSVSIKVLPSDRYRIKKRVIPKKPLSPNYLHNMKQFADDTDAGPLKDALLKLHKTLAAR